MLVPIPGSPAVTKSAYMGFGGMVCAVFSSIIATGFEGFPKNLPDFVLPGSLVGVALGWVGWIFPDGLETSFSRKRLVDKKPVEEYVDPGQMVGAKYHMVVESLSAIIVVSTVIGLIIGIMDPGKVTGAIFPVSLAAWYILYRILEKDDN